MRRMQYILLHNQHNVPIVLGPHASSRGMRQSNCMQQRHAYDLCITCMLLRPYPLDMQCVAAQ